MEIDVAKSNQEDIEAAAAEFCAFHDIEDIDAINQLMDKMYFVARRASIRAISQVKENLNRSEYK